MYNTTIVVFLNLPIIPWQKGQTWHKTKTPLFASVFRHWTAVIACFESDDSVTKINENWNYDRKYSVPTWSVFNELWIYAGKRIWAEYNCEQNMIEQEPVKAASAQNRCLKETTVCQTAWYSCRQDGSSSKAEVKEMKRLLWGWCVHTGRSCRSIRLLKNTQNSTSMYLTQSMGRIRDVRLSVVDWA